MKASKLVVIVNHKLGNLGSIANMLKKIGAPAKISSDPEDIEKADKLILPGVGSFDRAVQQLQDLNLPLLLEKKVIEDKTPILGICLGMQLFSKSSEEGKLPGLGWLDAEVKKFNFGSLEKPLKIPHMGWNQIEIAKESPLLEGLETDSRFYFVHSYHMVCHHEDDILARTHYGYDFVSSIQFGNIAGVQFHPEKSHKFGMKLLKNFVEF